MFRIFLLQWGHRLSAMETGATGSGKTASVWLQWGHRLSAMETVHRLDDLVLLDDASMGPPPFGDGNKAQQLQELAQAFRLTVAYACHRPRRRIRYRQTEPPELCGWWTTRTLARCSGWWQLQSDLGLWDVWRTTQCPSCPSSQTTWPVILCHWLTADGEKRPFSATGGNADNSALRGDGGKGIVNNGTLQRES